MCFWFVFNAVFCGREGKGRFLSAIVRENIDVGNTIAVRVWDISIMDTIVGTFLWRTVGLSPSLPPSPTFRFWILICQNISLTYDTLRIWWFRIWWFLFLYEMVSRHYYFGYQTWYVVLGAWFLQYIRRYRFSSNSDYLKPLIYFLTRIYNRPRWMEGEIRPACVEKSTDR